MDGFPGGRRLPGSLLILAALAGGACTPEAEPSLQVTVSVPPLAWLVSEVAGADVVIENLVEVGSTPETFQPTDLQISRVARSVLFFRIGVPSENAPWLSALEGSGAIEVVDLRRGLELLPMDPHHHGPPPSAGSEPTSAGVDPHLWLSPRRLETMAETVARHLGEIDPPRADLYGERAAAVRTRLRALDAELEERLEPVRGRAFLIFHPAWGYFADDYGLRQVAIEIEGKEPTEKELTHLVQQVRTLGTQTLFVQPQIHSPTPGTLARELGLRLETLDPLVLDPTTELPLAAERLLAAMLPEAEER